MSFTHLIKIVHVVTSFAKSHLQCWLVISKLIRLSKFRKLISLEHQSIEISPTQTRC
jgi:hypothetical protein